MAGPSVVRQSALGCREPSLSVVTKWAKRTKIEGIATQSGDDETRSVGVGES